MVNPPTDPYENIAEYYDCEHDAFQDDVAFYLSRLEGGPVLEVGTGTGRVLLPLARSGLDVWGVDPSQAMLSRARRRLAGLANAHLIQGSVDQLPGDMSFQTVILPLNTLWHLPDVEAQVSFLRELRAKTNAGGLLMIDVSNPLSLADRGGRGEIRERFSGRCAGAQLRVCSAAWDDEGEQTLHLSLCYDLTNGAGHVRRAGTTLELRYLYRYELELALRLAGFDTRHIFGTYDLDPFTGTSPNILVVAEAV